MQRNGVRPSTRQRNREKPYKTVDTIGIDRNRHRHRIIELVMVS